MKAISLKQPFAFFVANGTKPLESRMFRTTHRGDLLICSSKKIHQGNCVFRTEADNAFGKLDGNYQLITAIDALLYESAIAKGEDRPYLDVGMALCVVSVTNCRQFRKTAEDEVNARHQWYDGYVWELEDLRRIKPFPIRGYPGFFNVDDSLIKYL